MRQALLNSLAELESLKKELCENCKGVGSNNKSTLYICGCGAVDYTCEIGQELLNSIIECSEAEVEKVKKVARKDPAEITEEAVNEMREAV
ncbi:hypothetical protein AZE41_09105 [Sporosarcina psychrophila]|nr:hypothetical protein AZE41_09105 [Sporosarcina psychrophila]